MSLTAKLWERVRDRLGFTEAFERFHHTLRRIESVANSIDHHVRQPPRLERVAIVVWGLTIDDVRGSVRRTKSECFTLQGSVTPGEHARFELQPYTPFRMTRWLVLGSGRVRSVVIGHNLQSMATPNLAGVCGTLGEGTFDVCDVGSRIVFDVEGTS